MRSWQSEKRGKNTGDGLSSTCQGGEGEVLGHIFRADSMEKSFLGVAQLKM